MRYLLLAISSLLVASAFAVPTQQDLELAKKHAVSDLMLTEQTRQQDQDKDLSAMGFLTPAAREIFNRDDCNNSGSGSEACWNACRREGYSSSTCAGRCGVSTEKGSVACWNACKTEGYSSSTCAGRCGVSTDGGSAACWGACKREGYSSSTCAGRCGVSTDGGSEACWKACSSEGYSSSTCAGRCGVN